MRKPLIFSFAMLGALAFAQSARKIPVIPPLRLKTASRTGALRTTATLWRDVNGQNESKAGYTVLPACTGEEALRAIPAGRSESVVTNDELCGDDEVVRRRTV